MSYSLNPSDNFLRKLKKIIDKNQKLEEKIGFVLDSLMVNPFSLNLRSHKVVTKNNFSAYSSRINGDLRIIWNFNQNKVQVLDILDIGGHSGSNKVYK